MNDLSNVISPANPSALPEKWIEKLFQKMEDRYGSLWVDRYGQFPRERVKNTWAEDLAGFTGDEIKRGMDACKQNKFPPTLPEFATLCRPPINPETAFAEAVNQLRLRREGKDTWSNPAIYWAAQAIGNFDMNQPWATIKTRWIAALNEMLAEPTLPDVPAFAVALPAPGELITQPEEARSRMAGILRMIQPKTDFKAWAHKIIADHESGKKVATELSLRMAREAVAAS